MERLETYLEYHAMFCVAAQLLAERPLIKDDWEGDPWAGWLQQWTLTWDEFWLADRRDPTPIAREFWTMDQTREATWKWEITSQDFDRAIGLIDSIYTGYLIVDARQYRYHFEDYETLRVSTALVSPQTAPALLRAFQTTFDRFEYRIPHEGDELEIDEGDFRLEGWLRYISAEGGIDESDPLRNQLGKYVVLPGKIFTTWANLSISADARHSRRGSNVEKPITLFEHWNDCPQTKHAYGFRSEGHRLWIDINELLQFLKARESCLIVECFINRHSKRHDTVGEHIPGYAKLYLIYANGEVATLGRRYRLGKTTH